MHATHISFVDSFVRKRHAWAMAATIGVILAVLIPSVIWAKPKGVTPLQFRLILVGTGVAMVLFFTIRERINRRHYGLYILPNALEMNFHKRHRLDLRLDANGVPLVIIRKVGRQFEITSVSQKQAIYLPVAAIPTLPQVLLHFELDVKLVVST